jgi:hypothetical protein
MNAVQQTLLAHIPEAALLILLAFAALFLLGNLLARRAKPPSLRPIPAYARLRELAVESIETGQPLHVSLGAGDWGQAAPELAAGLMALDAISRQAAHARQGVCVTTGSPVALLLAMNLVQANGAPANDLHLSGPAPLAYAGGAAEEGLLRPRAAHLLLGRFGDEGLWLAGALQTGQAPVLGGASDPAAAALMQLATEEPVIGEDLYAAGAYLGRQQHLGSLAAQDWARLLLAAALLAGAILATLGIGG